MARRVDVIRIQTGSSRGTGFRCDERRVLTALHVLGRVENGRLVLHGPDITLTGAVAHGGGFRVAISQPPPDDVVFDERLDWACIQLDDSFPSGTPMALRAISDADQGASWHTYGFPDSSPDEGKGTAGTIASVAAAISLGGESAPVIQLFSDEAAAGLGGEVRGYSGAPVMLGDSVVGMLSAASVDGTTERSLEGTLYAIPISGVALRLGLPMLPVGRPRRRLNRGLLAVSGACAAVGIALVATWYPLTPAPLPDWLVNDFLPNVLEVRRLGKDLATASGHYLRVAPVTDADMKQELFTLNYFLGPYNQACDTLRGNRLKYRDGITHLADLRLQAAAAGLLEYASTELPKQDPPIRNENVSLQQQHDELAAHWREFETSTQGKFRKVAVDAAELETRIFVAARVKRPECPDGFDSTSPTVDASLANDKGVVMLTQYGETLAKLAGAVAQFRRANDGEALMAGASSLASAIRQNNASYREIMVHRLAATIDVMARSLPPDSQRTIACALASVDSFQNDQVSPALNALIVELAPAYGAKDLHALEKVRRSPGWADVQSFVDHGASSLLHIVPRIAPPPARDE